jgi:hypothetical protein
MPGTIIGLASDGEHRFAKQPRNRMRLVAGLGIEGGEIRVGDTIAIALEPAERCPLEPV